MQDAYGKGWERRVQGKNRSMVISLNGALVQRSFVLLSLGTALVLIVVGLLFITRAGTALSSQNVGRLTATLSDQMISNALATEIPYLTEKKDGTKNGTSLTGTVFSLLTGINPDDPRTFLNKELPGFALFDTSVLVAGNNVGIGDIPIESTPPPEVFNNNPNPPQVPAAAPPAQTEQSFSTNGKKVVFIYNTHNHESWVSVTPAAKGNMDLAMNADTNVTMLSKELAKKLDASGIGSQVSTTDFFNLLQQKHLSYSLSYAESLKTVKEVMSTNRNLSYFIDIHRDSLPRKNTTITINGVNYAQIYFIIGMRNKNWMQNEQFALQIHNDLKKNFPGLSKGIYGKNSGNAEYNQSVSPNAILIEVGGPENTPEECMRTIDLFAKSLAKVYWDAEKVNGNKQGNAKSS